MGILKFSFCGITQALCVDARSRAAPLMYDMYLSIVKDFTATFPNPFTKIHVFTEHKKVVIQKANGINNFFSDKHTCTHYLVNEPAVHVIEVAHQRSTRKQFRTELRKTKYFVD